MRKPTPCATCQHLGDAAFPSVEYYVGGELKSRLVGFSDRPNGKPVDNPARRCNHPKMAKTLVYEQLQNEWSCPFYEKRNWTRPETCGECQLRTSYIDTDAIIRCSGYPFCGHHTRDEKACINGRVEINSQLSLF